MKPKYKGIVLAGGSGSRLSPLTSITSKQLLPVYDKPMIYYPISTLMLAGVREILLISDTVSLPLYQKLLGDGSQFGISILYEVQLETNGIAEAITIGSDFIGDSGFVLILGDNLIYGDSLGERISNCFQKTGVATIFGYKVSDPERFGVIELGQDDSVVGLEEKPSIPKSNYAAIGLYIYPPEAVSVARALDRSERGELEITDVNLYFFNKGLLNAVLLGRGYTWFDLGTQDSLLDAGTFMRMIQTRTNTNIACLEEIAQESGWISRDELCRALKSKGDSHYFNYIRNSIS